MATPLTGDYVMDLTGVPGIDFIVIIAMLFCTFCTVIVTYRNTRRALEEHSNTSDEHIRTFTEPMYKVLRHLCIKQLQDDYRRYSARGKITIAERASWMSFYSVAKSLGVNGELQSEAEHLANMGTYIIPDHPDYNRRQTDG